MRNRLFVMASLAASLVLAAGASASAVRLPTGASTLGGQVTVAPSDGLTPQTFTVGQYTFTPVDDTGSWGSYNVIIVDVELPQGVTLTNGVFDVSSTCTTTNGSVTLAGSVAHVSGVSCGTGQTIVVDLDGGSLIQTEGTYPVTAQYKRFVPPRLSPRGFSSPNMWKITDASGFVVAAG